MPASTVAGLILITIATLAGAGLARRHARRPEVCLGAAAGALLVIACMHLLPDAWSGAQGADIPALWIPLLAAASFVLTGQLVRRGCACQRNRETAGGIGTTIALAAHRLLEGASLALTGSAIVAAALAAHALAEGLAAGTLLTSLARRRAALLLGALCLSPVLGVTITKVAPIPHRLEPLLLAAAAGVLCKAAHISSTAAFGRKPPIRNPISAPAVAALTTGVATMLAVRLVG